MPQDTALANLTEALGKGKVGKNGWMSVFSTASADAGRVVASSLPNAARSIDLSSADANGEKYVQQIVTEAPKLAVGETWQKDFVLPGASGAAAGVTTTMVGYYERYSWAIVIAGYDADVEGAVAAVRDGRRDMLYLFVLVALVLAVIGGGRHGRGGGVARRVGQPRRRRGVERHPDRGRGCRGDGRVDLRDSRTTRRTRRRPAGTGWR